MLTNFNLTQFIKRHVTGRQQSLLKLDFEKYHNNLSKKINGKKVMVIGGAGTIGSFYIKAILKFNVVKLVVVDINENGLTELVRDLRSSTVYNIPEDFITYPVNFGDRVFEKLFKEHGPFHIVANFAAHKHVRSEKDIFSIEAMIENNVLRARKLLDLLLEFPPEHFFCVSTDKAANPVNVMGASKKLMEELIMSYSDKLPIKTARFANVAFSNGSLPLGFLDRLNKRQPWSCPLGIRRFFVSPEESGELCLMASIMGESGDIFFPKLDEEKDMIPFDKIALALLKELGLEPDICQTEEEAREKAASVRQFCEEPSNAATSPQSWPIYFFGSDTSGEKSFEEFYTEDEVLDNESFINLGVIKNSKKRSIEEIDSIFNQLEELFKKDHITKAEVVNILKSYLPNFAHIETGKGLDQKM
ncbi:NAD-dependent epimerase/dehydratase family protein [Maribellus comscasis]|uniref:NAD-dependent epimerase/dehydratase family protein n=1 Tax=Maribellus comscasis TaxID=2681766 RepID=A0A6I6JU67_9BACT|nr:polysaccharide biosynthesis protein [Maribellus comscasis]QGY46576.1 NAD-dependent epimerase/dehydratase family protein [Maribellus comscasis]